MSKTTEQLAGEFLAEIEAAIDKHAKAYSKDARWHQFIVILSGACGLLSLAAGAGGKALLAGVLGGVTTMGSVCGGPRRQAPNSQAILVARLKPY